MARQLGAIAPALTARVRLERRAARSAFTLDVHVEVPAGITILFGPSGAGKSTLLDCIAGLLRPDAGHIVIEETVVFDAGTRVNLPPQNRSVAYVFQSLALFPRMTVEKNLAYGLVDLPGAEQRARIGAVLSAFRIANLVHRRPDEISSGERQRVALARSLVTQPRVLLLDEPLSALDAEMKASIIGDLRAWNSAQQIPILYVTHSRDEVEALAERVLRLDHGQLVP